MAGVGVLIDFSCTCCGVCTELRCGDCGVVGLSGEMERARSVLSKTSVESTPKETCTHLLCALTARCDPESGPLRAS